MQVAQIITESLGFNSEFSKSRVEGSIVTPKIHKTKNGYGYISYLTPFDAMIHNLPWAEVQRCFGVCAYQSIIPLTQKLEPCRLKLHEIKDDGR